MGAIFGVLHHDRRPVLSVDLERMAAKLKPRKAGAPEWRLAENVGGAQYTRTGRHSIKSDLRQESSRPFIVADARIDNRGELEDKIGCAKNTLTTSELILASYERWERNCVDHLVGDFAFAIWDPKREELFCVRDPFGVRALYYHSSPQIFLFATEIGPILSWPDVPTTLNDYRIAELITETFEDPEITIYQEVLRLPAAHCLSVTSRGVRRWKYWEPTQAKSVRYRSDDEYAGAFRSLFFEAVDCRVDEQTATGVTLSGGLDSSAVTCVLSRISRQRVDAPLPTFSAVYPDLPVCDEWPYIQTVVEQEGTEPHFVQPDLFNPIAELQSNELGLDEPLYWPTWCMEYPLFVAAQHRGVHALLTGHGGDHVLCKSTAGYYPELIRKGKWMTASHEVRNSALVHSLPLHDHFVQAFLKPFLRGIAPQVVLQARRRRKKLPNEKLQRLNVEFGAKLDVEGRWRRRDAANEKHERTAKEYHAHLLTHSGTHYGLGLLDQMGARFSFQMSHPFWDRRLVEFCYGLPPNQLIQGGVTGIILRNALSDLLPQQVLSRTTKVFFNPVVIRSLKVYNRQLFDDLMDKTDTIAPWVNVPALRTAHRRFFQQEGVDWEPQSSKDAGFLIAAATLALWFRRVRQ